MPHVWIVEVKDGDRYYPTPDCATSRERARKMKKYACELFSTDKYRIKKYVREEKNVCKNL